MTTTTDRREVAKQRRAMQQEMLQLMLRKANIRKKDIHEVAEKLWINENLDLLNTSERNRFQSIIL